MNFIQKSLTFEHYSLIYSFSNFPQQIRLSHWGKAGKSTAIFKPPKFALRFDTKADGNQCAHRVAFAIAWRLLSANECACLSLLPFLSCALAFALFLSIFISHKRSFLTRLRLLSCPLETWLALPLEVCVRVTCFLTLQ